MNYNKLIEIEKELTDNYRNPRIVNKYGSITVYESMLNKSDFSNLYYVFLSDWFMFGFQYNKGVIFYNEEELIDYLRR